MFAIAGAGPGVGFLNANRPGAKVRISIFAGVR